MTRSNVAKPGLSEIDHPERGSGTVLVVCLVSVVCFLCMAIVAVGAGRQTRVQTQNAADLAAIAAATGIQTGYPPCPLATELATKMSVRLTICRDEGHGIVTVEVAGKVTGLPFNLGGEARAQARAGSATH